MDFYRRGADLVLKQEDFDLDQTLDCGQAFRWERRADGAYTGFARDLALVIRRERDYFVLENTDEDTFLSVWVRYFDLATDYAALKNRYADDETLSAACRFSPGMRLLRQDGWEALCSFILSQNNNIPRIKGIIARMCALFSGFPTPAQLAQAGEAGLAPLRAGFRARYLADAAQKLVDGVVRLDSLETMSLADARAQLMQIIGVGTKVADCALLYGQYRTEVVPMDVWMKRVMARFYPDGLPACTAATQGIAQQYLFHYIRRNPALCAL
ncbi:MAG: DNA glycosylase [Oscillospiraceae bacterium]